MAHVRASLRDWLKTALAGSVDAGSRVHVRRALPLPKDLGGGPCLLLSIQNERSEDISTEVTQQRATEIRVTACVKDDSEAGEDTLDDLAVFVEGVFSDDPTLGGHAETYQYVSTDFAFAGEGEQTLCTAAFTFVAMLITRRDDPESLL